MFFFFTGASEHHDSNVFIDEQEIPVNKIKKRRVCVTETNDQENNTKHSPSSKSNELETQDKSSLEALEHTKALMAQFMAAASKNGSDEEGLKNLAMLQSTLHTLQNQQVLQMQLIQQLQNQLQQSKGESASLKVSPNNVNGNGDKSVFITESKGECKSQALNDYYTKDCAEPIRHDSVDLPENERNKFQEVSRIHSPKSSPSNSNQPPRESSISHISSSLASSIITNHDSTLPNVTNSLKMLEQRAEEVLDSASHGLLSGNLIDELAFRNKLDGASGAEDSSLKHRCRYCGKIFGSDSALQIHLRSHTGERPFKCNMCPSSFTTKGNLKVHYQRHTQPFPQFDALDPNQPLNYTFLSRPINESNFPSTVNFHKPTDFLQKLTAMTNEKGSKFPIDLCKNGSENLENLNDTKPYISPPMDKEHTLKKFDDHVKSNGLGPKSYLPFDMNVNVAPYSFGKKSKVWENLIEITPSPESLKLEDMVDSFNGKLGDPNKCPICHRTLSCRSALRQHYRTHTGERPFRCKLCSRSFTTKGNLKTHISVHKLKPSMTTVHKCPICHKRYSNGVVLQQHINVHTGEPTDITLDEIRAAEVRDYPNPASNSDLFGSESSSGGDYADTRCMDTDLDNTESREKDKDVLKDKKQFKAHDYSVERKELKDHKKTHTPLEIRHSESIEDLEYSQSQTTKIPQALRDSPNPVNLSSKSPNETISNMKIFSKFPPLFPGGLSPASSPLNNNMRLLPHPMLTPPAPFNPLGFPHLFGAPASPSGLLLPGPGLYNPLGECVGGLRGGNTTCNICLKTFACHSALEIHYRSHTKERPYKCTICNRGFSTKVSFLFLFLFF